MPKLSNFLKTLPILAVIGSASMGFAQETATQNTTQSSADTATATDTAKADETSQSQLDLGQEVDALGTSYDKEEIGDWKLQCVHTEQENDPCQLYQLLADKEGNSVAEVSLFRLPDGGKAIAGATVIVPLETLLTAQLTISVDGGKGKRYPFAFCNPIGCYARIGLTKGDISAFKKGANATVTLVHFAAPEQKIDLKLSLKGFTKGIESTSVFNQ